MIVLKILIYIDHIILWKESKFVVYLYLKELNVLRKKL